MIFRGFSTPPTPNPHPPNPRLPAHVILPSVVICPTLLPSFPPQKMLENVLKIKALSGFAPGGCQHLAATFPSKSRLERCPATQLRPAQPRSPSLNPEQSHPTLIFNSNLRGEDRVRKSRTGFELKRKALGAQIRTRPPSKSEGKGSKFELELAHSARRFVFVRSARPDIPLRRTIPIFNDFPNFPAIETPPT